jgi:hypothetical protein
VGELGKISRLKKLAQARFVSLPVVQALEESTGVGLLFKLRGNRTPPEDVVISSDKLSAQATGLQNETEKLPRSNQPQLVNRLAPAGAVDYLPCKTETIWVRSCVLPWSL